MLTPQPGDLCPVPYAEPLWLTPAYHSPYYGDSHRALRRAIRVFVDKYVTPDEFDKWRVRALDMGFLYCASGPLVRSSYKAGEAFIENVLRKRAGQQPATTKDLSEAVAMAAETEKASGL